MLEIILLKLKVNAYKAKSKLLQQTFLQTFQWYGAFNLHTGMCFENNQVQRKITIILSTLKVNARNYFINIKSECLRQV